MSKLKTLDMAIPTSNGLSRPFPTTPYHTMKTTVRPEGLTSLFTAFELAHEIAGAAPPSKPLSSRQWCAADERKSVLWSHPEFGSVRISPRSLSIKNAGAEATGSWAKLDYHGQPRNVTLDFSVTLEGQTRLFQCRFDQGGDAVVDLKLDLSSVYPLETPIDWIDRRTGHQSTQTDAVPSTRKKGRDDVTFILMGPTGRFVQIEVSVRTLSGALWIAVQDVYVGQVVTTTHQRASEIALTHHKDGSRAAFVAPLLSEGAYPGVDYIRSFRHVVEAALSIGAFCQFHEASVAEWKDPIADIPEKLKVKGYLRAVVSFYNISWQGGAGFSILGDGQACFLHSGQIMNETGQPVMSQGEFPFLYGGEVVAVKVLQGTDGRLKATAIRKASEGLSFV